ncbi:MAG: class I SAM-dependent methyltransferase [Candidatus Hermodarchaeota archaeon]
MRKIVEEGYNEGDYERFYRMTDALNKREKRFFNKLLELIPKDATVLDLGSGTGVPYDKFLVKNGLEVIGIDISSKHVAMARKNVPHASYIKADFSRFKFEAERYDAIISLYAIFHIPREEHTNLFEKIHRALKEHGIILVTMGTADMELDINDFIGSKMAWSSYSIEENKSLVEKAGFNILLVEEEHEQKNEHHLWILAKKIGI